MSLKVVPFESLGTVSYSPSIVIMAVSVAVCEIFSVKEWCDLENRVRVRSSSITRRRIGSHTGSRLNCYVQGRLLQSAVGWSTKVCYRQVAAGHERCSASCERHKEVRPQLDTPDLPECCLKHTWILQCSIHIFTLFWHIFILLLPLIIS